MIGKYATMTFLRNEAYLTRIETIPSGNTRGDTLSVPPHWHETHDEFLRIVQGRIEALIGSTTRIYVPEDGEICIPKGTVHGFRTFEGEHVIFEERTEPMDEEKELFFRNALEGDKMTTNLFQAMLISYYGDVRPAFPGHILWLEKAFVTIIGRLVAPLLGYKLRYTTLKKQN
ncbi:hypothetical protein NLJ89_g11635 [Agrocybe chaxingu]|uniref:Uncharacterized protein n=1 Tax=Agrocybe chaxingu TaxID=84603 RepID=A0A9W8MR02_9AGAR|nr:hypothetical protein NLJ89_g11635 [Agrocybe chaxingu]